MPLIKLAYFHVIKLCLGRKYSVARKIIMVMMMTLTLLVYHVNVNVSSMIIEL